MIKPTREEIAIVRAACRQAARPARVHRVEPGIRCPFADGIDHAPSMNILQIDPTPDWEESDLYTMAEWSDFRKGVPSDDGRAVVDFYVYSRDELETNVQAVFDGGRLVWAGILGRFGYTAWGRLPAGYRETPDNRTPQP